MSKNEIISKALKAVAAKNSVLPILDGVIIADNSIIATDLKTSVILKNVGIEGPAFFLYLNHFIETVLKFKGDFGAEIIEPEQPTDPKKGKVPPHVIFTHNSRKYKLPSEFVEDYPKILTLENPEEVGYISPDDIQKIMLASQYISKDVLNPKMMHVCLDQGEVAGTDGHRLYFDKTDFNYSGQLLLNRKTCKLLALFPDETFTVITDGDDKDHIVTEAKTGSFRLVSDAVEIVQQGLGENFVPFRDVIPKELPIKFSVYQHELVDALKEAIRYANKTTHAVVFNATEDGLTLTAEDWDFNTEFSCELESYGKYHGDNIKIAFNGEMLLSLLKEEANVTFELTQPNRAGIINGHFLLMPIMYQEREKPAADEAATEEESAAA